MNRLAISFQEYKIALLNVDWTVRDAKTFIGGADLNREMIAVTVGMEQRLLFRI